MKIVQWLVVKIIKQSMAAMDSTVRMVVTSVRRQGGGVDERHAGDSKSTGNFLFLSIMFISFFNYFLKFVLDFYNIIYFKIIKNTYLLML